MSLKELRKQKKLTQTECAAYLGVPLRTYQNYENDKSKHTSIKYMYMLQKLEQYGFIDETHGILSIQKIKDVCNDTFPAFDVEYCYLFGSYAKGNATEYSDVDLLISTPVSGMRFYELVETVREGLKKNVDVLNLDQLKDNMDLINEILKDGIKIYG
ncbi:nucleotidyltransferase [Lachnoclostridium sp. An169]|uniref:nucleotidyltransferase domain-containing protein n=1 Tax=Lachnoclostridium sp. An169 TaxID=1965569 RepID=UPI000B3A55C7|nr:nucleotidyltransferase domain-containing protein [Lachnoclostridium sp. An169]OUP85143.1 nucleotidyltransferase [Lachnoclostridium sp. An169]HJA64733.1 nucleotidyltransferase domain-containing protein [Candidatus Mediterraneibacter cottocaccae]